VRQRRRRSKVRTNKERRRRTSKEMRSKVRRKRRGRAEYLKVSH